MRYTICTAAERKSNHILTHEKIMSGDLSDSRLQLDHSLDFIPRRDLTKCRVHVELLVPLHAKLGKLTPVLLRRALLGIVSIRHVLQRLVLGAYFLLIGPILELLRAGGINLGIALAERIGVSGGRPPRVLRGHRLGIEEGYPVVHLLESLVPVPRHAHLAVPAVEFVAEIDVVLERSGTGIYDQGLVHLVRLARLLVGDRVGVGRVEIAG